MNEKNEENDNLVYEVAYHFLPTVEESEILTEASKIKSIIEENEGLIISEEVPKLLVLAYDISKNINSKGQKFSKAYFGWVKFEVEPVKVLDIKNKIESLPNVLRSLIVKTVKENTMSVSKIPTYKKETPKEEKGEEYVEKPKATEAELDKSIDELVTDQTL
ncbi:MAG: 30S ribosomal protein S6 [Candidatus Paceibacterota bacterium]|jgi:ribosomal protein S6